MNLDEIEIRSFYICDCADQWGARVWCAVTDGPQHATNERTKWTVYYRPNVNEMYPVKLASGLTLDDAFRVASDIAAAYRSLRAQLDSGAGKGG